MKAQVKFYRPVQESLVLNAYTSSESLKRGDVKDVHECSGQKHVRIQRVGQGSGLPLENYKNIGFLSNTGPDPLKITKLPIQLSMLGHHRPASQMPFKWRFAGGPMKARL